MKKLLKLAEGIENYKIGLFDAGFEYEECDSIARELFSDMTDKFGNVDGMLTADFNEALKWFDAQVNTILN